MVQTVTYPIQRHHQGKDPGNDKNISMKQSLGLYRFKERAHGAGKEVPVFLMYKCDNSARVLVVSHAYN